MGNDFSGIQPPREIAKAEFRSGTLIARLPLELYEQILSYLPLAELLNVAHVSRAFHDLTRWCLLNDNYIKRWRLAFNEEGFSRRIIPLDLRETRKHLEMGTGLYIFTSKIRPTLKDYDHIEFRALNIQVMSFGLRFLDFNDEIAQGRGSIPTESLSPDLRCGELISLKMQPCLPTPPMRWRISSTFPNRILWKVEFLPNELNDQSTRLAQTNSPDCFDEIQVSLSLEAIEYEYALRKRARLAREDSNGKMCVCNDLKVGKPHQEWYWDSTSGLPMLEMVHGGYV